MVCVCGECDKYEGDDMKVEYFGAREVCVEEQIRVKIGGLILPQDDCIVKLNRVLIQRISVTPNLIDLNFLPT